MSSYGAIDLSGTVVTAQGVAACRPRSLTVYGRSTQDGTPTPETPVAIESVDELALWLAAGILEEPDQTAGTQTPIDLQGHQLRSLPDGTRDELTVDAQGNVTLTRRVGTFTTPAETMSVTAFTAITGAYRWYHTFSAMEPADTSSTTGLFTIGRYEQQSDVGQGVPHFYVYNTRVYYIVSNSEVTDVDSAKVWMREHPTTFIYKLATPQTIDLGTVELPTLPSTEFTAWMVDGAEFEIRALLRTGHTPVMWDGEELSAGWVFLSDRHEQLLPRNVTTIDVPGRDGAIFGGVTQAVRQITLSLYVLGRPDERAEHVRELAARLAVDEPRPLRFGDELTRMAIPNADVMSTVYFDAEGWVAVTFTCPDPWLYGEVKTETLPSGGTLSITVGGTAPTWPTITANATGGSQGSWIVTLEDGTGIYAAIPSGTTYGVTANCDERSMSVNDSVAMLPPSYDWPRLAPGAHTLTMTQGTGDATITWQERWW